MKQECDSLNVREIDNQMRKLMVTLNLPLPSRRRRFAYSGPPSSDVSQKTNSDQYIRKVKSTHELPERMWKLSASDELNDHQRRVTETRTRLWERRRYKREITLGEQQGENSVELYYHQVAGEVCEDLARQLSWSTEHILWFAYGIYLGGGGDLQVHILLADETLSSPNASDTSANLTAAVEQTVQAFQQGDITLDVGGENLHPGVLSSCEDLNCQRLSLNVTAPPLSSMATRSVVNWSSLCLAVVVLQWGLRVN